MTTATTADLAPAACSRSVLHRDVDPGVRVADPARGALYVGTDGVAATAQADLVIAYANAAGQPPTSTLPVDLSLTGTPATPLLPGVHQSTGRGTLGITRSRACGA